MFFRAVSLCVILALVLALPGCGGGNEPVNEGADRPKSPKKEDGK